MVYEQWQKIKYGGQKENWQENKTVKQGLREKKVHGGRNVNWEKEICSEEGCSGREGRQRRKRSRRSILLKVKRKREASETLRILLGQLLKPEHACSHQGTDAVRVQDCLLMSFEWEGLQHLQPQRTEGQAFSDSQPPSSGHHTKSDLHPETSPGLPCPGLSTVFWA